MKHLTAGLFLAALLAAVSDFLMPPVIIAQETPKPVALQAEFRNKTEVFQPSATATLDVKILVRDDTAVSQDMKSAVLKVAVQRCVKQETETEKKSIEKNNPLSITSYGISNFTGRKHTNQNLPPVFEEEISVAVGETSSVPVSFLLPETEGVYEIVLTLHRKPESSSLSNSFRQLQNPLKRSETAAITQTVCQCVVFDVKKNTVLKKIQDLTAADLTETYTAEIKYLKELPSSKRWSIVPSLPKVGNLSGINLSGILTPESLRQHTGTSFEKPLYNETKEYENIPRCVLLFMEQYAEKPDAASFSSGHSTNTFLIFIDEDGKPTSKTKEFSIINPANPEGNSDSSSDSAEAWEGFPLQVKETGVPHLLEIEYPSDVSSLAVCLLDLLNGTDGKPFPNVLLNCNFSGNDELLLPTKVLTHKIVFYPKTKQPFLLLSNRSKNRPAFFGRISVSRIAEEPQIRETKSKVIPLPDVSITESKTAKQTPATKPKQRLFAAYIHRTDFWKQFADNTSATASDFNNETVCPADWNVFYNGTQQLVNLLKRNGYGGIMFNVCSKDTVLYPSVVLHYDSKDRFVNSEEHTSAKDALGLTARIFERENILFIPAVDFNMLLPVIENKIYYEPESAKQLLAADGQYGRKYNILNPLVQEAMLNVLSELISKCSEYKSFGGVAVILSPDGYAQLPVPSDGLDAEPLHLRCKQVSEFYHKVETLINAIRPDARLYFVTGTMFDRQEINQYCQPSLFIGNPLPQIFQLLGFDLTQNAIPATASMLLPQRITSSDVSDTAFTYQLFNTPDFNTFWKQSIVKQNGDSPVLFFHETEDNWNVILSAEQSRKRFVKQLVLSDVPMFFDGGNNFVPVSETAASEFSEVFRQLPATAFQTFNTTADETIQPLTVRYAKTDEGYYVYLLNNAPFTVKAKLLFNCNESAVKELSGKRSLALEKSGGKHLLTADLTAYDFVAVRFDDVNTSLENAAVECSDNICGQNGTLRRTINLLGDCIKKAQQGRVWNKLENPGCEPVNNVAGNNSTAVSGWEVSVNGDANIQLDTVNKRSGLSAVCFSKGNKSEYAAEPAVLYSNVFPAPQTGRLLVSVNLGMTRAVPLNVILSGKIDGKQFVRTVPVDTASLFAKSETTNGVPSNPVPLNTVQWRTLTVPFDRIPMSGLKEFRIGFVLTQHAAVWIDDIVLYDLSFTKDELNVLYLLVSAADKRCSARRYSELLDILDGYWGRYLSLYFSGSGIENNYTNAMEAALLELVKASKTNPEPKPEIRPAIKTEAKTKPSTSEGYFERMRKWLTWK